MVDRDTAKYSSTIAGICTCVCLIITIPLFTAGYLQRVAWNKELVDTQCRWSRHDITPYSYTENCNCIIETTCDNDYYYDYYGSPYVVENCVDVEHCSICQRQYFNTRCVYEYIAEGSTYTDTVSKSSKNTQAQAQSYLKNTCPLGKSWKCYYHKSKPSDVVETPYNETVFLVFSIIFFIFSGTAILWLLISLCIWKCPSLSSKDIESPPSYDVMRNELKKSYPRPPAYNPESAYPSAPPDNTTIKRRYSTKMLKRSGSRYQNTTPTVVATTQSEPDYTTENNNTIDTSEKMRSNTSTTSNSVDNSNHSTSINIVNNGNPFNTNPMMMGRTGFNNNTRSFGLGRQMRMGGGVYVGTRTTTTVRPSFGFGRRTAMMGTTGRFTMGRGRNCTTTSRVVGRSVRVIR